MVVVDAYRALKAVWNHPLCSKRRFAMLRRFLAWHVGSRLVPGEVAVEWVNSSRFLARPWHSGLSANIYCGLLEFNDMSFVLHVLRKTDLFIDIGANRGAYTVLAGAAVGASVLAFEPIPDTFAHLKRNVSLNDMGERVRCHNIGLGDKNGELSFTANVSDCINHVLSCNEHDDNAVSVRVCTLDTVAGQQDPFCIKMDVEGYEWFVLKGAAQVLENMTLSAIIIECGGQNRYGIAFDKIHDMLTEYGFSPFTYDPFLRSYQLLNLVPDGYAGNLIYGRNLDQLNERLKTAAPYKIFSTSI